MRTFFILGSFLAASFLVANCGSDSLTCDESRTCAIEGDGSTPIDGGGDVVQPPLGCDSNADPKDSPKCVDDGFGVFVDGTNGQDGNPGTKAAPLKSISGALGKLSGKTRVYVCSGQYAEHVKLTSAVSIYGSFVCGTWAYDSTGASKAKLAPEDRGYALQLVNIASAVTIEDLELSAKDGTDEGESSIAVFLADSTAVTLKRLTVIAGNGVSASDSSDPATNLFSANPTELDGNGTMVAKGAGLKDCPCKVYGKTAGGAGGDAGSPKADKGGDGTAMPAPAVVGGRTGMGGTGFTMIGPTACTIGAFGSDGSARLGGVGAQVHGVLDSSGWVSASGTAGEVGNPGGGGGGGGGGGALGGAGGGCGGCGGAGGLPGKGGGSSIGIAAVATVLHLTDVAITSSNGGKGGGGGKGEVGAAGGNGGASGSCTGGGIAGNGAGGGGGGGGAGGLSAGVVRKGGALDGTPMVAKGQAAAGGGAGALGTGGTNLLSTAPGGVGGTAGLEGVADDVVDIN